MKRNRIILTILWLLSLAGISFFAGPVSYGFFFLFTAVFAVSVIYVLYVYFFYRIYQELEGKSPVAGQSVPFYFTLMNEFPLGFTSIRVGFFTSFSTISGLEGDPEYELPGRSGIKKRTELVCRYRGEYEVGIKTVEIQDPFRLIRFVSHNRETLRVIVKPRLIDLAGWDRTEEIQTMSKDSLTDPGEPDVIVRKYFPGDDVRQINWKASARSGELLVRKLTGEEREGISVIMGTERISDDPFTYLPIENKMLELTLALCLYFVKRNIPARTLWLAAGLCDKRVSSLDGFDEFYDELSLVEFKKDSREELLLMKMSETPGIFQSKTVFLVLNRWSEQLLTLAGNLRMNNVSTVVYLIDKDVTNGGPGEVIPGVRVVYIDVSQELSEAKL